MMPHQGVVAQWFPWNSCLPNGYDDLTNEVVVMSGGDGNVISSTVLTFGIWQKPENGGALGGPTQFTKHAW